MKKSFQKSLIAASVGVAMLAAVGTASANSLIFPYFTTASGAQSVISLSNTGATAPGKIHYVYNYGPNCTHFDAYGTLTTNDILTHSIASPAAGGFGKAVGSDTSSGVFLPLANQTGFLVVSHQVAGAGSIAGSSNLNALRGSMAIVDPATGLVVSYPGVDNKLDTSIAANEGNYAALTDINFPLTALPVGLVNTSFYTVVAGDMSTVILAGADWKGNFTLNNNGQVFNNDEVAFSGTVTKPITCLALLQASDFATAAQAAAVGTNGGLINVTATLPTLGATGLIVSKIQTILPSVGGVFGGKTLLHRENGPAL